MATQTTGGGSTTSFGNTPQAKDDLFTSLITGLTENSTNFVYLDVMGNDLGGMPRLCSRLTMAPARLASKRIC